MTYLSYFIEIQKWSMFPAVVHFTTHIIEDCKRFKCAAGYLSAYPFENEMSIFGKVRVHAVSSQRDTSC